MRKCLSTVSTPNAVQQRNGSYWRVREPLTLDRIATHLLGRWTLGTYLLDQYSCCSFAVFDADGPDGLERLVGLSAELAEQGIPTLLEASRRGGHLWVHLAGSTPARHVRAWLVPYATAYGIELYPKQDWRVPGGPGSLIRLPLGIHQRSRNWYPFVWLTPEGRVVPVGETVAGYCLGDRAVRDARSSGCWLLSLQGPSSSRGSPSQLPGLWRV
jgi:hypothetical protein